MTGVLITLISPKTRQLETRISPANRIYFLLNIRIEIAIAKKKPWSLQLNSYAAEFCLSKEKFIDRKQNPRTNSESNCLLVPSMQTEMQLVLSGQAENNTEKVSDFGVRFPICFPKEARYCWMTGMSESSQDRHRFI